MLERMWSEGNTHPLLVGVQLCAATLEISAAVSKEIGSHPTTGTIMQLLGMSCHTKKAFAQL